MECQYTYMQGIRKNKKCNKKDCGIHSDKQQCKYFFIFGKRRGDFCNRHKCKKHAKMPCQYVCNNGIICNRFLCKRHKYYNEIKFDELINESIIELVESVLAEE